MKKVVGMFAFVCGFLTANCLLAQEPDSLSDLKGMVEAERSFARMSVTDGVKEAFVENLSEDAIIFRPGPVKGRPVWQQRKPLALVIRWEPEYVDIAASGDFGYSTGPAEYFSAKALTPPIGYGYFISIWKKQSDRTWRVALDIGTEAPTLENGPVKIHFPQDADKKRTYTPANADMEKAALLKFEEEFDKTFTASKTVESFLEHVAADARFYREGRIPVFQKDSVRALLFQSKNLSWKPIEGSVAASGDMAYTYGTYRFNDQAPSEEGYYFRVWKRKDFHDPWKIHIEALSPVPPQK